MFGRRRSMSPAAEGRRKALIRASEERDVPALLAALDESPDDDRKYLVGAIGFVRDLGVVEAIPQLKVHLESDDHVVRSAAAKTLGKLGATETLPALIAMAQADPEKTTRAWAMEGLRSLGDPQCVEPLCEIAASTDDLELRTEALSVVGDLGASDIVDELELARAERPWYERRPYTKAIKAIRQREGQLSS